MDSSGRIVEALERELAASGTVRLAVLFGSRAKGTARADSDADVGVLPIDETWTLSGELELARRLSEAVGVEVDLVRLDRDDPVLGLEIARHGQLLFEVTPGTFSAWRAQAASVGLEFEEVIAPHRRTYLERLARRAG